MNPSEPAKVQSPAERQGILIVLACFVCCAYLFNFAAPAVAWLNSRWAAWLIYATIPLLLTFTLLHGSRIHREMSEAARDAFLLFVSLAVFIGVAVFMVGVVILASVFTGFARIGP